MYKRIMTLILCLTLCLTAAQPAFAVNAESAVPEEETAAVLAETETEAAATEEAVIASEVETEAAAIEEAAPEMEAAETEAVTEEETVPETEAPQLPEPEAAEADIAAETAAPDKAPEAPVADEVQASSGSCGTNATWTLSDGVLTISGSGAIADYDGISIPWYSERSSIKSVVIGNGIVRIGNNAFNGCTALTSITFPTTIKAIGEYVFSKCTSLTSLTIPSGVVGIDKWCFNGCSALQTVSLPASLASTGLRIFDGCTALKSIDVDAGSSTFKSVDGVMFSKDGKTLYAYPNAKGSSYSVPDGVTTLADNNAFYHCSNLTSITLPSSLTTIGWASLAGTGLKSIMIPAGVTTVGLYAFDGCSSLKVICFVGAAPSFETSAFGSVTADVYYPSGDSSWTSAVRQDYGGTLTWKAGAGGQCGDDVWWELNDGGYLTLTGSGETWDYFSNYPGFHDPSLRDKCKYIIVEDGITALGAYLFFGMSSAESVEIKGDLTAIWASVFGNCAKLTEVRFLGHAPESIASEAFSGRTATVYYYPVYSWTSDKLQNYGGTLTWTSDNKVGEKATWYLGSSGKLTIAGEGKTWDFDSYEPGFYEFRDEVTKAEVLMYTTDPYAWEEGNGYGVTGIGNYLFWEMDHLEEVRLAGTVTSIGDSAFSGCTALKDIIFCGYAPSFGDNVFSDVTAQATYFPLSSWTDSVRQSYGGSLTWVCDNKAGKGTILDPGSNVTWSYDEATGTLNLTGSGETTDCNTGYPLYHYKECIFYFDQSCKKIVVGEGITYIGRELLSSFVSVKEIVLPNTLTRIGKWALIWCKSCTKINLPSSLKTIDQGAMQGMEALTSIKIPDGVTKLEPYTFWHNISMTSVTLPEKLTEIGEAAFQDCFALSSITIPTSVKKIGVKAFAGCNALKEVHFKGHAPTSIDSTAFTDVTSKAYYYPVYSWTSAKMKNYGGTLTWTKDDKIGDNVTWKLDADGTMTFSGTGATKSYGGSAPAPCSNFGEEVKRAVFDEGITVIGSYIISEMTILESIQLPSTLTTISRLAILNCASLTSITIPASVTKIEDWNFDDCDAMKEVIFLGPPPAIEGTAFWFLTITAYYPAEDASWTEDVKKNYGAQNITWLPYRSMTLGGDKISATLPVKDSTVLRVKDQDGNPVTNAAWASDDETIATVDATGKVTAHKYGKCMITASTEGGVYTAECELQTLFWDVADPSKYYFQHVYWAAENGITNGYDLERFEPQTECSREQMMTFLWRMMGKPEPKSTTSKFSDVKKGAYYYKAVLWGVENGITNGYSSGEYAGKFGVGLACTREQAMTFMWRMAGKPNPKTTVNKFKDVKSSDYFYKAVLWASENGIANGYSDGTYGVGLACLREHMVTFLSRYAKKFM